MTFQITGFGSLAYVSEPESGGLSDAQENTIAESLGGKAQGDATEVNDSTQVAADDSSSVVSGADAPVSPTNASTHLDISAEDLLSEEELSAAYSKRMARSAWDYSSATFADVLIVCRAVYWATLRLGRQGPVPRWRVRLLRFRQLGV